MALWDNFNYNYNGVYASDKLPIVFQNSDLNLSYELGIYHSRGTVLVVPLVMFDPNGIKQDQAGIFQVVDKDNCKISFGGSLPTGKFMYILQFIDPFKIV
jgi:hypothetical protein